MENGLLSDYKKSQNTKKYNNARTKLGILLYLMENKRAKTHNFHEFFKQIGITSRRGILQHLIDLRKMGLIKRHRTTFVYTLPPRWKTSEYMKKTFDKLRPNKNLQWAFFEAMHQYLPNNPDLMVNSEQKKAMGILLEDSTKKFDKILSGSERKKETQRARFQGKLIMDGLMTISSLKTQCKIWPESYCVTITKNGKKKKYEIGKMQRKALSDTLNFFLRNIEIADKMIDKDSKVSKNQQLALSQILHYAKEQYKTLRWDIDINPKGL